MSLFVDETPGFSASTNQINHLSHVFASLTPVSNQATIHLRQNGITITANSHICNIQALIEPSLFNNYSCSEERSLGVDIQLLSEAFNSVAPSAGKKAKDDTTCYISYLGEGNPFVIEFEDQYVSEKLEFFTFYGDSSEGLLIDHSEVQYDLILKSEVFSNLLADLQQINTVDLFINVSNEIQSLGKSSTRNNVHFFKNDLNFVSRGPIGHSKLIYPSERTVLERIDIFEKRNGTMEAVNATVSSCYNFATFSKILKAVKLSAKCKLLKDLTGVLSVQLLCRNAQMPSYSGTLITFHMLELEYDGDVGGFDDEYEVEKRGEHETEQTHTEKRVSLDTFKTSKVNRDVPLFL